MSLSATTSSGASDLAHENLAPGASVPSPATEGPPPVFDDDDPVELPLDPLPTREAAAFLIAVLSLVTLSVGWSSGPDAGAATPEGTSRSVVAEEPASPPPMKTKGTVHAVLQRATKAPTRRPEPQEVGRY